MAMIHLSCGHEVSSFAYASEAIVMSSDREGNRALSYELVCEECLKVYERDDMLFKHEADAIRWLINQEP